MNTNRKPLVFFRNKSGVAVDGGRYWTEEFYLTGKSINSSKNNFTYIISYFRYIKTNVFFIEFVADNRALSLSR